MNYEKIYLPGVDAPERLRIQGSDNALKPVDSKQHCRWLEQGTQKEGVNLLNCARALAAKLRTQIHIGIAIGSYKA
jgi:hypothetical protein